MMNSCILVSLTVFLLLSAKDTKRLSFEAQFSVQQEFPRPVTEATACHAAGFIGSHLRNRNHGSCSSTSQRPI
jgi:hypothetical protein